MSLNGAGGIMHDRHRRSAAWVGPESGPFPSTPSYRRTSWPDKERGKISRGRTDSQGSDVVEKARLAQQMTGCNCFDW